MFVRKSLLPDGTVDIVTTNFLLPPRLEADYLVKPSAAMNVQEIRKARVKELQLIASAQLIVVLCRQRRFK